MREFKDNADHDWTLNVNVTAIKRVRDLLKVDLLEVLQGKLLERLGDDPVLLVDVVYVLCKPQAEQAGITDVQFGEAMAGDAIDAATTALLEELVDFFPERQRRLLGKALGKLKKLAAMTQERAEKRLAGPTLDKIVEKELDRSDAELETKLRARLQAGQPTPPEKSGKPSTDLPAPPASTPAR